MLNTANVSNYQHMAIAPLSVSSRFRGVSSRFRGESQIWFSPGRSQSGNSSPPKTSFFSVDLKLGTSNSIRLAPSLITPGLCRVKSEDPETKLSGEDILLDQQSLEQDLQIAIEEEDYAQAAKIRDSLRILHEDSKALVLATNARFYKSFRTGDLAGMQSLWAPGDHVCCVHPGVPVISGYDLVIQSWEYVLADYEFPLSIELKDVLVHVRGDLGYVTCVEFIKTKGSSWGRQNATNVFERVNGQWFICVHQASRINT